jgi:hypothetical protein
MPTAPSCAIVIFGASGDLAKRKLIPAIYELAKEKLLDEKSYVMGYSRSPMSDDEFRKTAREAVEKYARSKPVDPQVWKSLESRMFYTPADYGSMTATTVAASGCAISTRSWARPAAAFTTSPRRPMSSTTSSNASASARRNLRLPRPREIRKSGIASSSKNRSAGI